MSGPETPAIGDYYIVVPASPWGGKRATFGPMGEEEAQERLNVYLPLYMPECPPKLLRVVKDYASDLKPADLQESA